MRVEREQATDTGDQSNRHEILHGFLEYLRSWKDLNFYSSGAQPHRVKLS